MTFHFYCTDCKDYLGKYESHLTKNFDKTNSNLTCPNLNCQIVHDPNSLKEGNFFATLSISYQISALLELELVRDALSVSLKKINDSLFDVPEKLSDITDGELYKEKRRHLFEEFDISLTGNTDESPVFKSSRASMWLIQEVINELPPQLRWAHGIVGGLWFGKGHPNMKLFIEAYVNELQELSTQGVFWKHGNTNVESRVFTLCGGFDSPARCAVQNMVQFNGYFGCPWCLHPGVLVEDTVKYVTLEDEPELRTEETIKVMEDVLKMKKGNLKGIKGSSPMILAKGPDFLRGICHDYMHAVLLGVTRQLTDIYLTSVGEQFYVGTPNHVRRIDSRLLSIKPPHSFTRLPRSIADRIFWKANEWKTWLLYYAAPCLSGILPDKFLRHFSLLSSSVFLLLQDLILPEDTDKAEEMLTEFVIQTEIFFGSAAMTFNIHQMLHIASSVRDLGPLWAHSAFVFEGGNGKMLNLVTAAKAVPLQVLNRFCLEKKLEHLFNNGNNSDKFYTFYKTLHCKSTLKNCRTVDLGLHLLGKEKVKSTFYETEERAYITAVGGVPETVSEYSRIIYNSRMYHSELYTRAGKTDNTVVSISGGSSEFVKITKFVLLGPMPGTIDSSANRAHRLLASPCKTAMCGSEAAFSSASD
ncbi:hypothetical protein JTE90_020538 [Oedothorax gibbosus]|uniref:Uncharacterized protein n=1 Tax=Oedothorax gibbosus TaxID=931172 RepID=A0AAV6VYT1_9ARAC|nr:hypothetical protein JTE90_020538 [Oedothorax gibbosus]